MSVTPIQGKINSVSQHVANDIIFLYTDDINKQNDLISYHEYYEFMPELVKAQFRILQMGDIMDQLELCYPSCTVQSIEAMNELYITSVVSEGSDQVFESEHVDGPFFFLPFCTVLRCVYAIQGNNRIFTDFPNNGYSYSLKANDFVIFDYNRDLHYIWRNTAGSDKDIRKRILLKLHYLVTPRFLPRPITYFYKQLHAKYNQFMRTTFLNSQKKGVISNVVNGGTVAYRFFYKNAPVIFFTATSVFLSTIALFKFD